MLDGIWTYEPNKTVRVRALGLRQTESGPEHLCVLTDGPLAGTKAWISESDLSGLTYHTDSYGPENLAFAELSLNEQRRKIDLLQAQRIKEVEDYIKARRAKSSKPSSKKLKSDEELLAEQVLQTAEEKGVDLKALLNLLK